MTYTQTDARQDKQISLERIADALEENNRLKRIELRMNRKVIDYDLIDGLKEPIYDVSSEEIEGYE